MHVNQVSSQSFGQIFNTKHVGTFARKNRKLFHELQSIRQILNNENLDSLEYVDIVLHHSNVRGGFYGVILSKNQGVPNVSGYSCKITTATDDVQKLVKWARDWNNAFSPEELQCLKQLEGDTLDYVRHSKR